ncbi:helix-turn-helix domain-containing protein [Limosilactobacillus reuteri]|nr:helix-turn-helix transcriptional regulator [Limosilactobacillus reuteri]
MIDKKALGQRIKAIRLRLGLTMEEFIERIDNKPGRGRSGTVNNWETGKNAPNKQRLKKIAELGGVSVEYLINGSRLSVANIKKLAKKIEREDQLTNEEISQVNEALLDTKIFSKTLSDSTNQKAKTKLKKQQQIINKYPLNPFDRDLYADLVALFNLLRLEGSERQYVSFSTLINFMFRIANGTMKYDKDDILPNVDKLLSSFPIKDSNKSK